jgi:integrase
LASEELVPVTTFQALQTVTGLRAGKSEAVERAPVQPVPWEHVEATLPYLPPHVATIIKLMWFTGMRPAEACQMRLADIDRSVVPWVYRPQSHKTAHHGRQRLIPLGENARGVLAEYLQGRSLNPDDLLFSPERQQRERFERLRANRKTRVQPCQTSRRAFRPKKLPGEVFTATVISRAVHLACTKYNAKQVEKDKNHKDIRWFPYQIRHAYGTRVRKDFGLEHAQVSMGHSQASITQVYAQRDLEKAVEVAKAIG